MPDGLKRTPRCAYCGEPVTEKEWDEVAGRRVPLCSKSKCEREARDDDRAAREHAMLDALDDNLGRYL